MNRSPDNAPPAASHAPHDVEEAERAAAEAPLPKPVSRWAIHRRMYDWVLGFAHHRHATSALAVMSFAESSFFPIPPDVLLAPLCLGHRKRSVWFAAVTTVASVLGAYLGYLIGYALIDLVVLIPGVEMGAPEDPARMTVRWLHEIFATHGTWVVFVAALTPLPFKLLTITSGFATMDLLMFTGACIVGRGVRFFAVAGLLWWIGPKALPFIDRYFNLLCIVFAVLLVGGFAVVKLL